MGGRVLDANLAVSLIGRETPNDLSADRHDITFIRLLDSKDSDRNKEKIAAIRKVNISFNPLQQPRALDGLEQVPQLRQLLAYTCGLQHPDCLSCLRLLTKLEILYLQQNFISAVPDSFRSLNKLVELRLDRNKITKIENIQICSSLKILDLSSNQIKSLDGISGLQSLQELKVSGNCIESLTPCRSLPSLKELDLSNNRLTSLEGLQQLPTLQYFKADHNYITSLIYSIHQHASNTISTKKKGLDSKDSQSSSFSASKTVASSSNSKDINKKGASSSVAEKSADSLPKRAESAIAELSLAGNKLKSLEGIEIFSKSLEILDISFNFIQSSTNSSTLLPYIGKMKQLAEVRVNGNPICEDESAHAKLSAEICSVCPTLRAVDGNYFVSMNISEGSSGSGSSGNPKSNPSKTVNAANDKIEVKAASKSDSSVTSHDFHTWEKGGEESTVLLSASVVGDGNDDDDDDDDASLIEGGKADVKPDKVEAPKVPTRAYYQLESDSEADEADAAPGDNQNQTQQKKKSASSLDGEYDPKFASAEDARIAAPRLTLQSLKTPEEILAMETKFTNLVNECKQILGSTVFAFAGDVHEHDSTKISAMLAEQQEEEHEKRASYVRSIQERKVETPPRRNSGAILDRQLQDMMDRPASKGEEVKIEEEPDLSVPAAKSESKEFLREEKEVIVPATTIADVQVAEEKQESSNPVVFEKPSVSPSRKSNHLRKSPAPVNAAFNSSILASGVTRHGTKVQTTAQGKVKVVASEDGLILLSPPKDGLSSSLASQLENVKITKREPKVFLNSKVVTFPDMSLNKSPDPAAPIKNVITTDRDDDSSVQELKGMKRFACVTNVDPRSSSSSNESAGNQSHEKDGLVSPSSAAANEVYPPSQSRVSNNSPLDDSDGEASDDGSVVSIMQEAADAIRGSFNKSKPSSAHVFEINEGDVIDDDDEGVQAEGEDLEDGDEDGLEEQENQENKSVIKIINQISLTGDSFKKFLPNGSASVVQVMNSPRLPAERQTGGIAMAGAGGGGRKYSTMKFKIPQGAQSAIRGSLDGGSRTVPATLHSSDDSEAKPVNFRQVNSAPDLK